jgi:nitrite reductase/ring-hydroxylating ferredoxin subunit
LIAQKKRKLKKNVFFIGCSLHLQREDIYKGQIVADPYIKLFDLRTNKLLAPLQVKSGPLQLELSKHAEVSLANVMNSTVQSRKYHQEA